MLVLLHPNVRGVASVVAKDDQIRFSGTSGVRVSDLGNGLYEVAGTDGRRLIMIRGPFPDPTTLPPDFLRWAEIGNIDVPNSAIVPLDTFLKGSSLKSTKDFIGVAATENEVSMGTEQGCFQSRQVDGRFPSIEQIFGSVGSGIQVYVDPKMLLDVIKAAVDFKRDDDVSAAVQLIVIPKNNFIGISATNQLGQAFDGIVVGLNPPKKESANKE